MAPLLRNTRSCESVLQDHPHRTITEGSNHDPETNRPSGSRSRTNSKKKTLNKLGPISIKSPEQRTMNSRQKTAMFKSQSMSDSFRRSTIAARTKSANSVVTGRELRAMMAGTAQEDEEDAALAGDELLARMTSLEMVGRYIDYAAKAIVMKDTNPNVGVNKLMLKRVVLEDDAQLRTCMSMPMTTLFFLLFVTYFYYYERVTDVFIQETGIREGLRAGSLPDIREVSEIYSWFDDVCFPYLWSMDGAAGSGGDETAENVSYGMASGVGVKAEPQPGHALHSRSPPWTPWTAIGDTPSSAGLELVGGVLLRTARGPNVTCGVQQMDCLFEDPPTPDDDAVFVGWNDGRRLEEEKEEDEYEEEKEDAATRRMRLHVRARGRRDARASRPRRRVSPFKPWTWASLAFREGGGGDAVAGGGRRGGRRLGKATAAVDGYRRARAAAAATAWQRRPALSPLHRRQLGGGRLLARRDLRGQRPGRRAAGENASAQAAGAEAALPPGPGFAAGATRATRATRAATDGRPWWRSLVPWGASGSELAPERALMEWTATLNGNMPTDPVTSAQSGDSAEGVGKIIPMSWDLVKIRREITRWKTEGGGLLRESTLFMSMTAMTRSRHTGVATVARVSFFVSRGGSVYVQVETWSLADTENWNAVLVIVIWACLLACRTLQQTIRVITVGARGLCAHHFSRFSTLFEWVLISGAWLIVLCLQRSKDVYTDFWESVDSFRQERAELMGRDRKLLYEFDQSWFSSLNGIIIDGRTWNDILLSLVPIYTIALAVCVLMASRGQPRLALVVSTMMRGLVDLAHLFIVCCLVLLAYVMSGHGLFGMRLVEFSTWQSTLCYVMQIVLQREFQWLYLTTQDYMTTYTWIISLMLLMVLVMLNIVLAMIFDTYGEVRKGVSDHDTIVHTTRHLVTQMKNFSNWVPRKELLAALSRIQRGADTTLKSRDLQELLPDIALSQLQHLLSGGHAMLKTLVTRATVSLLPESFAAELLCINELRMGVRALMSKAPGTWGGTNSWANGHVESRVSHDDDGAERIDVDETDPKLVYQELTVGVPSEIPGWLDSGLTPFMHEQQTTMQRIHRQLSRMDVGLEHRGVRGTMKEPPLAGRPPNPFSDEADFLVDERPRTDYIIRVPKESDVPSNPTAWFGSKGVQMTTSKASDIPSERVAEEP